MKWPSELIQKSYFWNMNTHIVFFLGFSLCGQSTSNRRKKNKLGFSYYTLIIRNTKVSRLKVFDWNFSLSLNPEIGRSMSTHSAWWPTTRPFECPPTASSALHSSLMKMRKVPGFDEEATGSAPSHEMMIRHNDEMIGSVLSFFLSDSNDDF